MNFQGNNSEKTFHIHLKFGVFKMTVYEKQFIIYTSLKNSANVNSFQVYLYAIFVKLQSNQWLLNRMKGVSQNKKKYIN